MRKFAYSSTHLRGEILLGYSDDDEWLVFFDISGAEVNKAQHEYLLRNFPLTLADLKELVEKDKEKRKITEVKELITFADFWIKYDHTTLSSKKKSLAIWEKLSEAERIKAYEFIPKYFYHIMKNNIPKMYANTYLNEARWNN